MPFLLEPSSTAELVIMGACATCCEILLAILLPPLGVVIRYGCGVEFWICLLLTLCGYIPGIIYAVCILLQ
ncbi:putative proteolipid membrane potential modulator [Rosa chinensis]|uniref:Putative proteolipid membrane potential modulator n=2 Tax=Rosa chinensis TaxID=74649 RepID=A0A2P6RAL9_ROSCH|nr:putative proteolipid membrane potential modulator [Rosa chinensis]